ncbi:hypothetical protein CLOM_g24156 [Closterium sp. NIES-68]|nr:hypothetical protein CLOM_g24156 [Closterium sp. NIES-68]GJP70571.1 hypothetical protein CLOP_g1497 [Closterium sp. NIES-67]
MAAFPPQIPPGPPQPAVPSLDLTGLCFRDQIFLNFVGGCLVPGNVFDYFANSPFYDRTCNNEQLRMQGIHPLDTARLREMVGWEYSLHMAQEPHLFVLRKQKRDSPDRTTPVAAYYILDGSIYQAPSLHAVIGSRISRALHHLRAAFAMTRAALDNPEAARSKEDKSEPEADTAEGPDTPAASEAMPSAADVREMARLDHVIMGVVRKLTPAPPPPDIALPSLPQPAAAGEAATAEDKTGGADSSAAARAAAATGAAAGTAAGTAAGASAAPATGAGATTTGASKKGGTSKASAARKAGTGTAKAKAGTGTKAGAAGKSGTAGGGAGGTAKTTKAAHPKPTQEGEGRKVKKAKKA